MSQQKRRMPRLLGVESLEGRAMMAGNVNVSITGGDLVVAGDNAGNRLQIVQVVQNGVAVPGRFVVTGQNGTRINGQSAPQTFQNVNDDFRINLNGGDDLLTLGTGSGAANFTVPDDLEIATGEGRDGVLLNQIGVRDDATINTGNAADSVGLRGSLIGVNGGDNNLAISTGGGADFVQLDNSFVRRNLNIDTGTDNFTDVVDLLFTSVGNDVGIRTGGGTDIVECFNCAFSDDLNVETGAGTDSVSINQCTLDELFVNLGGGIDTLELTNTSGRRAALNGGLDPDSFFQNDNNFTDFFQAVSF